MGAEILFKAMADTTRQRLLQVLSLHELSVSELVDVLEQPQSTISRHLKILREVGLVADRRFGTTVMYAARPLSFQTGSNGLPFQLEPNTNGTGKPDGVDLDGVRSGVASGVADLRDRLLQWAGQETLDSTTLDRVQQVSRRRSLANRDFFESVGTRWDQLRIESFGNVFHYEALTALLPRDWTVADIGSGTGYWLPVLAAHFHKVIAIDPASAMLDLAQKRPELRSASNVIFREGSVANLPLETGEADLVIVSLVLHHVVRPEQDLEQLRRCVRDGGRLLIIEQQEHRYPDFHDRMGDHWWGFAPETLAQWVKKAGFSTVRIRPLSAAHPTGRNVGHVPALFALTAEADAIGSNGG